MILMDCLGVLAAVSPDGRTRTLGQFRSGLSRPMRDLLPSGVDVGAVGDVVLLESSGDLAAEAEDILGEHYVECAALDQHWTHRRVRAEQEEKRLYEGLRELGATGYARARGILTDHPSGELRVLRRMWDDLWPRFGNYEPVSGWPWAQLDGWWYPCPGCKWPMRVTGVGAVARVACEAHSSRGIRYTVRPGSRTAAMAPLLQPSGEGAPDVTGLPATSAYMAVSRPVWRFVTLPGVLECEIRDHALDLGAHVEMWPDLDSYDIRVEIGRRGWRIDAKAWASPVRLVDALRDKAPDGPLYIVLPDHQRAACHVLEEALRPRGFLVRTASQVKAEMSDAARRRA
ncbi:MAG: hypothetical protein JWM19_5209 [Actinomycetia bacterium]|nr:hypothetical protein [Actinomycetes bacterium]